MKKGVIYLIFALLFVTATYAQSSKTVIEGGTSDGTGDIFTGSPYDADGDGVCDESRSFYAADRERYDINRLGCIATAAGDLCSGTPSSETASRIGDNSGCSPSQTAGFVQENNP